MHERERHLSRGLHEQQDESALAGVVCDVRRRTCAKDTEGLAALKAWDEKHLDAIVYEGGPLGPKPDA